MEAARRVRASGGRMPEEIEPVATASTADPAATDPTPPATARRPSPRVTWRLLVPLVTAAAGLMFAMSFQAAQGRDLRADRDLPQLIMEGDDRVAATAEQLDALQREVEALSTASAPTDEHLSSLTRRAEELSPTTATTAVRGPGLEVALDDAKRSGDTLPDGFTGDDVVVHQQDVQAVVNALWASGAEAMMIQDQRVISTSAVRCVGNTLILQGRVYAPPYRISAIGDVSRMQQGLDADPSVTIYKQYVDAVGLGYSVATHGSLEFPAYSGSVDFQYATPMR
ncbi:DUF881 domain-containing protein [Terrabacter aeriphilus]|uniref:DUF881 domain-containing protein n=2 Tax=Terrabacter aeriphilus TaxID=515662 RepID=A0ABP9J1A8_9MICO